MTKRAIVIGQQGRNSRAFTWLVEGGVQIAVRMYITSVGEKPNSQGPANAVTAYLKEEDIGIDEENTLDIPYQAYELKFLKLYPLSRR